MFSLQSRKMNLMLTIASTCIFVSMAYVHSHVYDLPPLPVKIISGLIGGLILGLISNDMKEAVVSSFITLFTSIVIVIFVLSLPVFFGIVNDPGLANIFILTAIKNGIYDTVFLFPSLIISSIVSGLVKEHVSHVPVESALNKSFIM